MDPSLLEPAADLDIMEIARAARDETAPDVELLVVDHLQQEADRMNGENSEENPEGEIFHEGISQGDNHNVLDDKDEVDPDLILRLLGDKQRRNSHVHVEVAHPMEQALVGHLGI